MLPSWVFLEVILFVGSLGVTVFDTVTDWQVVVLFDEFYNSTLSGHVAPAWYTLVFIGTVLTAVSIAHDLLILICSTYASYRNREAKKANQPPAYPGEFHDCLLDSPYSCGLNVVTRREVLGVITLWLQDGPLLAFAYFFSAVDSCRDSLLQVAITLTATTFAATWRTGLSIYRLCISGVVRRRHGRPNQAEHCCLPREENDALYPPENCGGCGLCCMVSFGLGLIVQVVGVLLAMALTFATWGIYADPNNSTC